MAMLEFPFLLAFLLDPVQAALVLAVVLAWRGPVPFLVAAVSAALVSETIMALAAADYAWGEMMVPRLLSSLVQAAMVCWIIGLVWPRRGVVQQHGAGSSRVAPWHTRAFVRRRLLWLRTRKMHS